MLLCCILRVVSHDSIAARWRFSVVFVNRLSRVTVARVPLGIYTETEPLRFQLTFVTLPSGLHSWRGNQAVTDCPHTDLRKVPEPSAESATNPNPGCSMHCRPPVTSGSELDALNRASAIRQGARSVLSTGSSHKVCEGRNLREQHSWLNGAYTRTRVQNFFFQFPFFIDFNLNVYVITSGPYLLSGEYPHV